MSAVNQATARFDPRSKLEPHFARAVELYKDGSISWYTCVSLDGEEWGIVSREDQIDPCANVGGRWEAEEVLPCGTPDWETIIAHYPMDWDEPPSDNTNTVARFLEGSDWLSWWEVNFELAGLSAPTGRPYYRYIEPAADS